MKKQLVELTKSRERSSSEAGRMSAIQEEQLEKKLSSQNDAISKQLVEISKTKRREFDTEQV